MPGRERTRTKERERFTDNVCEIKISFKAAACGASVKGRTHSMDGKVKGLRQNHVDESELGHFFILLAFCLLLQPLYVTAQHLQHGVLQKKEERRI